MKLCTLVLTMLLVNIIAKEEYSPTEVIAKNILEWIQGIYRQGARKIRQQSDNAYLPPYNTQRPPEKPRPFQPAPIEQSSSFVNVIKNKVSGNYPAYVSQSSSDDSFSLNLPSLSGFTTIQASSNNVGYSTGLVSSSIEGYPVSSTSYLPPSQTSSSIGPGYPYPSSRNRPIADFSTPDSKITSTSRPGSIFNSRPKPEPKREPDLKSGSGTVPETKSARPDSKTESGFQSTTTSDDDDLKHPPHIHSLDVECSKTMMTIDIEFNRIFNGVIYSKGFFMVPQCRYVEQDSGQIKYSFTLNLDSCGTQFINDFEGEAGQAYLENVLVLQNEPGIQEVWDTIRTVRCLWEGNINKALNVSLSVDMLNQELLTFNGDTAIAKLDIQNGKGPFAPAANGLVKIGDTMTLVVSVEGDPGFDVQVRDCIARDELSTNIYELTDERGCILKPKLFGAFQKTNETGNSGASIIAYAFFQAFKFPDVMDLFIECNIELCKANCEPCPELNQQIEPGRRRRSIIFSNSINKTRENQNKAMHVSRGFHVFIPEDLPDVSTLAPYKEIFNNIEVNRPKEMQLHLTAFQSTFQGVCFSYTSFYTTFTILLITLALTSLSAILMYVKFQHISYKNRYDISNCL